MGLRPSELAAILSQRVGSGFALLASTQGAAAFDVVTAGMDTTGARLIVVFASVHTAGSAGVLTDSRGNTWTSIGSQGAPGASLWAWYCIDPSVGAGHTFAASTSYTSILVLAFSGPATTSYQTKSSNSGFVSTIAAGSVTPSANGALIVSGSFYDTPSNSYGVSGGLSIVINQTMVPSVNWGGSVAYLVQDTAAAINPAWTLDPTQNGAALVAVFLP